jgi:peptidoglycan hydrolase-like protein with peptidoglycan-binding domain
MAGVLVVSAEAQSSAAPPTPAAKQQSQTKAAASKGSVAKTAAVAKSGSTATSKTAAKKTTTAKSTPPPRRSYQQQPTTDRYKEIQQALADRGYFKGTVDGAWGPESADALKQFQREQKIDDDGKINSLSLIALGLGPRREVASNAAATRTEPALPTPATPESAVATAGP